MGRNKCEKNNGDDQENQTHQENPDITEINLFNFHVVLASHSFLDLREKRKVPENYSPPYNIIASGSKGSQRKICENVVNRCDIVRLSEFLVNFRHIWLFFE